MGQPVLLAAHGDPAADAAPKAAPPRSRSRRRPSGVTLAVAVAVAYFAAGIAGDALATAFGTPSLVWPAAGVAVGWAVLLGRRALPGLVAGATGFGLAGGVALPWWAELGLAAGGVAGAWAAGELLRRSLWFRPELDRLEAAAGLVAVGAVTAGLVAGVSGGLMLWASGAADGPAAGVAAAAWWLGDAAGVVLVAPAMLTFARLRPRAVRRRAAAEVGLTAAAVAAVGGAAALLPSSPEAMRAVGMVCSTPLVAWSAIRFGPRGAAAASLLTASAAFGLTALGLPLFPAPTAGPPLYLVLFLVVSAATALCLGAVIAERDAALAGLRSSEERGRALLHHSHDAVAVLDPDGRVRFMTGAAGRLTGRRADWLVGRPLFDDVHPDDAPAARAALAAAVADPHAPLSAEFRLRRADGGWVRLEAVGANLLANPAVGGVVLNARDVTARVAAERDARRSAAQYRQLFQNTPIAVWELDASAARRWVDELRAAGVADPVAHASAAPGRWDRLFGLVRVRDVNRAAAELTAGGDPAAPPTLTDLLAADDAEAFARGLAGLGEKKRAFALEARARRPGGGELFLVVHAFAPDGPDGRPDLSGVIVTAVDLTERRRLEEQVRHAQKMDAIGRLAGGVAHDFNNLLTVINGFSEMLVNPAPVGSRERGIAEQIGRAGDRAAALTRQLLAFGRRQPAHVTRLDLNGVVAGMEQLLARLLGEDVRLAFRPGAARPVRADATHVEQVVLNLCVNARDAMPDGGVLTVCTGAVDLPAADPVAHPDVPPGRYTTLTVTDTGCGMTDEVKAHLFEPFFTTKGPGKGTGLGLATVFGIVTQAGGRVRVDSRPGEGTTFTVYLPSATTGELAAASTPPPPPRARAGVGAVLLVEDEPAVRELTAAVLVDAGYEVVQAGSGVDGLAAAEAHPGAIDLLLTDVVMPGMNGRQLAERLTAVRPGVRVLFVSGYTQDVALPPDGVGRRSAFLPKPYAPADLIRAVHDLLSTPS